MHLSNPATAFFLLLLLLLLMFRAAEKPITTTPTAQTRQHTGARSTHMRLNMRATPHVPRLPRHATDFHGALNARMPRK